MIDGDRPMLIDWGVRLPAPAKLNLFLHVIGRRADGYHRLQTIFRLIDRADWLVFSKRSDDAIRLAQPLPGVPEAADLVIRAAQLLAAEAGRALPGVTIAVDKQLPMGGGLGGGSSDAATTLIALNHLWRLDFSRDRLATLGLQLGADVPVFVRGANAFGEGVGEQLTPVELPDRTYVIVVPPVAVPTKEVFADPSLTRDTGETTITAFFAGHKTASPRALWGHNDLEVVVLRQYPEVRRCHEWLAQFGAARMTGSGSCVFLECATEAEARAVVAQMPSDIQGFSARGLARHPLAEIAGG